MAQQTISIGTTANDGTGDPLRTAFNKINSNFTELYTSSPFGKQVTITGNQITANASNADLVLSGSGTGGVTASFAMLGDVHIAEPGATIGFAGKRVIEKTVKEKLPDNFQTSEYLLEHGMVDIVADRKQHREILSNILDITLSNIN